MVSATITRTGRVRMDATRALPEGEAPVHVDVCKRGGGVQLTRLPEKQFARPEPAARARSAQPLPETTLRTVLFPRGRHGGPGSGPGLNETKRAVGKTAIPYRSLRVTRLSLIAFSFPPATAMPMPKKPASAVWIGTRARPLAITVLPTIVVRARAGMPRSRSCSAGCRRRCGPRPSRVRPRRSRSCPNTPQPRVAPRRV